VINAFGFAFKTGCDNVLDDEGEEAATRYHLERGLEWVHRAFNEIILLATTVSPLEPGA
jgi:hypothetical protein